MSGYMCVSAIAREKVGKKQEVVRYGSSTYKVKAVLAQRSRSSLPPPQLPAGSLPYVQ